MVQLLDEARQMRQWHTAHQWVAAKQITIHMAGRVLFASPAQAVGTSGGHAPNTHWWAAGSHLGLLQTQRIQRAERRGMLQAITATAAIHWPTKQSPINLTAPAGRSRQRRLRANGSVVLQPGKQAGAASCHWGLRPHNRIVPLQPRKQDAEWAADVTIHTRKRVQRTAGTSCAR